MQCGKALFTEEHLDDLLLYFFSLYLHTSTDMPYQSAQYIHFRLLLRSSPSQSALFVLKLHSLIISQIRRLAIQ